MIQTSFREGSIPKEAPWKTSALNERTCKGSANLVSVTSGTERKRGFVGIEMPVLREPLVRMSFLCIICLSSMGTAKAVLFYT